MPMKNKKNDAHETQKENFGAGKLTIQSQIICCLLVTLKKKLVIKKRSPEAFLISRDDKEAINNVREVIKNGPHEAEHVHRCIKVRRENRRDDIKNFRRSNKEKKANAKTKDIIIIIIIIIYKC